MYFRFQFPAFSSGSEPHWSKVFAGFASEISFREYIADVFSKTDVMAVREATAFERAEFIVSDHNERNVSCLYGSGALFHVKSMFGETSPEAVAYSSYLASFAKRS